MKKRENCQFCEIETHSPTGYFTTDRSKKRILNLTRLNSGNLTNFLAWMKFSKFKCIAWRILLNFHFPPTNLFWPRIPVFSENRTKNLCCEIPPALPFHQKAELVGGWWFVRRVSQYRIQFFPSTACSHSMLWSLLYKLPHPSTHRKLVFLFFCYARFPCLLFLETDDISELNSRRSAQNKHYDYTSSLFQRKQTNLTFSGVNLLFFQEKRVRKKCENNDDNFVFRMIFFRFFPHKNGAC